MVRRLWGCYSVADHLEPRAFVADLLLYDRLVVPVPAEDDRARWEKHWNPARQDLLLGILGDFVERIEWSAPLREQFELEWSPGDLALEVDSAFGMTRRIVGEQLQARLADEGDVRAVAVYAKPDRFDREWKLTRTMPFVRRESHMQPGVLRQAADVAPAERQQLARLVVTRLVVPDDGRTDEEVLKRTVDLVSRDDIAERRTAFHEVLASLEAQGLRDETIVGEIEDALEAFNELLRRRTKAQRARIGLHVLTNAEGAAALLAPPVGLTTGPTTAIGEAVIQRYWGEKPSGAELGAVSLLAEAQRALAN
jgi:hypothetical protein